MPTNTTPNRSSDLPNRLLGVWAHPDDEAYLTATLMGRTIEAGGTVTNVTATLGEAGFPADDPRSPAERAALRHGELRNALAVVGVGEPVVLGLGDGEAAEWPMADVVDRVAERIERIRPDIIVTFGPDGVTGHPDHIAIGRATTEAWRRVGIGRLLYPAITQDHLNRFSDLHRRIGIYGDGFVPAPDILVSTSNRASGWELDRKRAVLAAHGSQTDGLAAMVGERAYRQWIADERFRDAGIGDFADASRPVAVAAAVSA